MSYHEVKNIFFQEKETSSKKFERNESWKERIWDLEVEWRRQELLLLGNKLGKSNFRAINWVICFGHSQLLQFLFDQVTKHGESIRRVLSWEVQGGSENSYISNLEEQMRLLMLSCYSGDVKVVKLLLKHCDTECINGSNKAYYIYDTPVVTASRLGHIDVVDLLIKGGADCNKSSTLGETPLCEASRAGHVDIVDMLIKYGVYCNKSGKFGTTPLCEASRAGHVDIVDMLIKSGADCNKSGKFGTTPLSEASRAGHVDIVELLIKSAADCKKNR